MPRAYEVSFSRDGVWLRYPPDPRWWRGPSLADAVAEEKYAAIRASARTHNPPKEATR